MVERRKMMMNDQIRIATVYRKDHLGHFNACDMSLIRWVKISETFARKGYAVDMIVNAQCGLPNIPNLRFLPYEEVEWRQYDVVKTLFHEGFDSLCSAEGNHHPFIISKMGSVVGSSDETEGVHFFNRER